MEFAHADTQQDSVQRTARAAGAVYVAMGVCTAFGYYHAPLAQTDPAILARTLEHANSPRFGIGVVADQLAAVLHIPLVWLLYRLFAPVNRAHATLMALLLIMAVPMSFGLSTQYVAARAWLVDADMIRIFSVDQRVAFALAALRVHAHGVMAVEIFWGLWLLPLGLLILRSRFLPSVIGRLLLVAGAVYVAHSLVSLIWPEARLPLYERITMLVRAAGEFPLMLWLLIRGANLPAQSSSRST